MRDLGSEMPEHCGPCGAYRTYADKHGYVWCSDCERLQGRLTRPCVQPSLFTARFPGDPIARDVRIY
jgi:hypothetical protein